MCRLVLLVAFLAFAAPATASNIATPRMAAVASWAAAEPLSVWCENDDAAWTRLVSEAGLTPAPGSVAGFTRHGIPIVYLGPHACLGLAAGVADHDFAIGLHVLLHESYTHYGNGVFDQAIQECAALVLIYSALHDFYGVPWRSAQLRRLTQTALTYSLRAPPAYQGGCARLSRTKS